jgi:succinoglycan biosynthesis transport protein ExoP
MNSDKLLETHTGPATPSPDSLEVLSPRISATYANIEQDEPSLKSYWLILQKRKWTVIACTVVVATLAAIASFRQTPLYAGATRLTINRENPDPLGFSKGEADSEDYDYSLTLETQLQIMQSDELLLDAAKQLQLDKNPAFVGKVDTAKSAPAQPQALDPQQEAMLLGRMHSGLSVSVVPRTRIIEIQFLSPDPKLAAQIANTLANVYIEHNFRTKFESTMQTSDWLAKQLSDLQMRVETAQEKLVRYQRENGIVEINDKEDIITDKLNDINKQLTEAEGDRIQKEARYRIASSGDASILALTEGHDTGQTLMDKLRATRADLQTQFAQLNTQFGPSYPKVLEIQNQIREVESAIENERQKTVARMKSDYEAALQREKLLRAALERQKVEASNLNQRAIEYSLLKRDVDTSRQLYEGLLQKLKEAGVSAGLRSSNIQVIDIARVPLSPVKPNIPRNVELGFLLGLVGGVVLAFGLEALDSTVRTADEVMAVSRLPVLGIIPLEKSATDTHRLINRKKRSLRIASSGTALITHTKPNSEIAEAYKALRTSVLLSSSGMPPKIILVTSPLPKEGKTTTAVNMATALAQRGARVLLVDTDLRRPALGRTFGMKSAVGLSTLLTGGSSNSEVIFPTPEPNLFIVPAGPIAPHPSELLHSQTMFDNIDKWQRQFDHVILDSPPILSVTDAVLLSTRVNAVLLVVHSGQTTKQALKRTRDILLQVKARMMGVVVNAIDLSSPDYYHYYYYGTKGRSTVYYSEECARTGEETKLQAT